MESSVFPNRSVVKTWEWNGSLDCSTSVVVAEDRENAIKICDDEESILFRTIRLRKAKATPPKPAKKQTHPEPDRNTSFLPAPIHKMSIKELRNALKAVGLPATGSQAEMRARLSELMSSKK